MKFTAFPFARDLLGTSDLDAMFAAFTRAYAPTPDRYALHDFSRYAMSLIDLMFVEQGWVGSCRKKGLHVPDVATDLLTHVMTRACPAFAAGATHPRPKVLVAYLRCAAGRKFIDIILRRKNYPTVLLNENVDGASPARPVDRRQIVDALRAIRPAVCRDVARIAGVECSELVTHVLARVPRVGGIPTHDQLHRKWKKQYDESIMSIVGYSAKKRIRQHAQSL